MADEHAYITIKTFLAQIEIDLTPQDMGRFGLVVYRCCKKDKSAWSFSKGYRVYSIVILEQAWKEFRK